MEIRIAPYGSPLQKESVELRYRVLREPLGLHYTEEQLAAEKVEWHLVALKNGKVAGVVVLKDEGNKILKMRQVAVDPALQRSGIGRRMVAFSEHFARDKGFTSIVLHARDTAKEFYLSMDYKIEGDSFYEVGILHYEMYKKI